MPVRNRSGYVIAGSSEELMYESAQPKGSRISKAGIFWIVVLFAANALFVLLGSPQSPTARPVAAVEQSRPSIRLLSELTTSQRELPSISNETPAETVLSEVVSVANPALETQALVCRTWGPFGNRAALAPFEEAATTNGSAIEVHASQIAGKPRYLVYVETGSSFERARRTRKELAARSIDAFVMVEGDFRPNAVSVGIFNRRSGANRQKLRVESLGYDTRVQTLDRSQTVFHLVAWVPRNFVLDDTATACATIASVR